MRKTSFLKDSDHLLTKEYLHKKLVQQGLSVSKYASLIGVSVGMVRTRLKEQGIDLVQAREEYRMQLAKERSKNMSDGFRIKGKISANPFGRVTAIMR